MQLPKSTLIVMLIVTLIGAMIGCGESQEKVTETMPEKVESSTDKTSTASETEEIDPMSLTGVGPVSSVNLGEEIDEELAKQGEELFTSKGCNACHQMDKRLIGPALEGITQRRNPVWIMNMILNPEEMVKNDPLAKQLLAEYAAPMSNQHLTEEEARAILEYFRKVDTES